ncbi:zymogen granule membrane protein 16-like [Ambystoma mexicanum]|uniref:zymogen granule membrane protein 16-like n=1 Tax=Ambystoma mexicanum TaxID=8296 RepID=UPI0037E70D50
MYLLLAFALLAPTVSSAVRLRISSFSGEFGGGSGTAFTFSGQHIYGPITGLRIRESTSCIQGIQIKHGNYWSPIYGLLSSPYLEVLLDSGEYIKQVSGKYSSYVNELIFLTNQGRMFRVGQPSGTSFNSFPLHGNTFLRYISGRYSGSVITSIGFHWDRPRGLTSNQNITGVAQVEAN